MIVRPALDKGQGWHGFFFHWVKSGAIGANHQAMRNGQTNDHEPDYSCRKASDSPQDIDTWLEDTKEMRLTASSHNRDCANSRYPKLRDADSHVETKPDKWPLIAMSDTSLSPHAVMVKFVDALATRAAMRDSGQFVVVTPIAVSACQQVFRVDNLAADSLDVKELWEFGHLVTDAVCLDVAPETHNDVEPSQVAENSR